MIKGRTIINTDGNTEKALRKFKKLINEIGMLQEVRERQEFVKPTISISSPDLMVPCSTRPVTTVPRPEMENTSSMGIKKGLLMGRSGSLM